MNTFSYPAKQRPRARSRIMFLEAWECFKEAVLILLLIELPQRLSTRWQHFKDHYIILEETPEGYVSDTSTVGNVLAVMALLGGLLALFALAWLLWILKYWLV